jgi:hypothetical protein
MSSKNEAERIIKVVEVQHTSKHASWLNVAEIEIYGMAIECTDRRIRDKKTLIHEAVGWTNRRNDHEKKMN